MNRITEGSRALAEQMIDTIMKEYDACALAACIIDHTGKTQYELFRGNLSKESDIPVSGDTIFGLASVTKSFTSMAIMKMAEDGLIDLDDPISKYIPEFTNKNTETVTIRHLLSHAGGFFPQTRIVVDQVAEELGLNEEKEGDLAYSDALAIEGERQVAQRLDSLTKENGLIGRPGQYLSYCNDGFGLLSGIIRRYGNADSYAEYLNRYILEPLGMNRSFCDFVKPKEDPNAAVLYEKKDGVMTGHRDYHDNAFVLNGGGAMKSTLNDLKKYLELYLNMGRSAEGIRIVSEYSLREMTKPRMPYGLHDSYGYGLYTWNVNSMQVIGHGGSLPGVSSNIAFTYDNDCAVIVLCNTSDVPVSAVSDILMRMYAGMSLVNERVIMEQPWDDELRNKTAGRYESGEGTEFELKIEQDRLVLCTEDGKKPVIETGLYTAVIRNKYSDTVLRPVWNENKEVFAVQYGSRIIPRKP